METAPLTSTIFPAINAALNSLAALFLLIGYLHVRRQNLVAHKKAMWTAFGFSALFLASYLYYHFNYTSNRFAGEGAVRYLYFAMLISHIVLAVGILPFILRLLYLATRETPESNLKHARLGRKVWPVWMYNSVTGVLVYFMLYHWFPGVPT